MKGIFEAITNFFGMIWSIITLWVKFQLVIFKLIGSALKVLYGLVNLLPLPYVVGGVALVSVCVIYKILGRETQS